ncbi:MAG TPA: glutathione S-transferase family protein, partial [Candidatus Binataceae bacterium]|nr:glutathione S-transferase family protein [Candidatus Binataceae bacterium]
HLNLRAGDQNQPAYVKMNPKAVVPTIVDHGQPVIESTVICEYLDDAYPDHPLRPQDPIARARMRTWTQIPDTGLHMACAAVSFTLAFRHQYLALGPEAIERYIAGRPDPAMRESFRARLNQGVESATFAGAIKAYDKVLTQMAQQLESTPWLEGKDYSLADIGLIPYIVRLDHLSLGWMWDGERASIGRWLARCSARPNFSGIANYVDQKYLDLMVPAGRDARSAVAAIIAH